MNILNDLSHQNETVWINKNLKSVIPQSEMGGHKYINLLAAQNRLLRFMPYISGAFPETTPKMGLIESELIDASALIPELCPSGLGSNHLFIKDDAHLPVAGSVKARGGIHEVLYHAEKLLQKHRMLTPMDDYSQIDSDLFRDFFSQYTIQVGSTGNLGLSIGIMSAKLGFKVIVHMSSDAKDWKKALLRSYGVTVKEYDSDYSSAVAQGRAASAADPNSYFVDDENSEALFFGYSTAALRLKVQLYKAGISVDNDHPLFVYIPCGVGGAPGGITYGLKQLYGDNVHCFFAEPLQAPCFTLGMATRKFGDISVSDIGLSGKTSADGLAVGTPSTFVCRSMDTLVSGSFTVADETLTYYMKKVYSCLNLFLEPSACAGFHGITFLQNSEPFKNYISDKKMTQATHIVWATGGGLVPPSIINDYLYM